MKLCLVLLIFSITAVSLHAQKYTCDEKLPQPIFTTRQKASLDSQLNVAIANFRKDSTGADAIIWLGRRYGYLAQYNKAIDVFTYGIKLYPADARMYRHRGHRYITTRCFDKAVDDLKKAAELIQNRPDETEPDGQPNASNIPVSTLHQNIFYHLGLAYYCKNNLAEAEAAWQQCYEASNNDDSRISSGNWLYLVKRLQMKNEEAAALLQVLPDEPTLVENHVYHEILQLHRKRPTPQQVTGIKGDPSAESSAFLYGLIMYYHLNGYEKEEKEARQKMRESDQVASFGFIAEEYGVQ